MVNTSVRPITVDGFRLDTLGWNVTKIGMSTARRIARDTSAPFSDGVAANPWMNVEPAQFALQMWVRGTDLDGVVPGVGQVTTLRNNLDELLHLFGKRHALLDVQEQVDVGGTMRRAWCRVTDVMAPDLNDVSTVAQFTVALEIVSGTWEDVATADWTTGIVGAGVHGVTQEVTTLQGATEMIGDGIIGVFGPCTGPRVTDVNTGAWVQLAAGFGALVAGQMWKVNCATWQSSYGSPGGLAGVDTGNGNAFTTYGGITVGGGPFLPMVPVRDTGLRRVKLSLTAPGAGAQTSLQVRAKRHWAV